MRKLSLVATVSGALVAAPVWAEETQKTETSKEQRMTKDSQLEKTEAKTTRDPGGAMNSTTDSTSIEKESKRRSDGTVEEKAEKTQKHDPGGLKKSSKSSVKEKTVKDSQGNVIEHEKKMEK